MSIPAKRPNPSHFESSAEPQADPSCNDVNSSSLTSFSSTSTNTATADLLSASSCNKIRKIDQPLVEDENLYKNATNESINSRNLECSNPSVSPQSTSTSRDTTSPPSSPPSLDLDTPTPSLSTSPARTTLYDESENESNERNFSSESLSRSKFAFEQPTHDNKNNLDSNTESLRPLSLDNEMVNPLAIRYPALEKVLPKTDKETYHNQLKQFIGHQFDLEILLKHHELKVIQDEISKIHVLMLQMRRHSVNPKAPPVENEPAQFTEIYAKYLDPPSRCSCSHDVALKDDNNSSVFTEDNNYMHTRSTSHSHVSKPPITNIPGYEPPLTRSKSSGSLPKHDLHRISEEEKANLKRQTRKNSRLNELDTKLGNISTQSTPDQQQAKDKLQCVIRRSDGVLVKLTCPECLRDNFYSPQGFINHCRISHSREFTSHESALATCGVEIAEQDEIGKLAQKRREEEQKKLNEVNQSSTSQDSTSDPSSKVSKASNIKTTKLSLLLKSKKVDVDLGNMVANSMEKYSKGHLLEDEEDEETYVQDLGEEATPFQRALAEAKKLNLNVEELCKGGGSATTSKPSGRNNKRKKSGAGGRSRRASGRNTKASTPSNISTSTTTSNGSSESRTATTINKDQAPGEAYSRSKQVGGKYKPGTAPNPWDIISTESKMNVSGKSLPGKTTPSSFTHAPVTGKTLPGQSNISGKTIPGTYPFPQYPSFNSMNFNVMNDDNQDPDENTFNDAYEDDDKNTQQDSKYNKKAKSSNKKSKISKQSQSKNGSVSSYTSSVSFGKNDKDTSGKTLASFTSNDYYDARGDSLFSSDKMFLGDDEDNDTADLGLGMDAMDIDSDNSVDYFCGRSTSSRSNSTSKYPRKKQHSSSFKSSNSNLDYNTSSVSPSNGAASTLKSGSNSSNDNRSSDSGKASLSKFLPLSRFFD